MPLFSSLSGLQRDRELIAVMTPFVFVNEKLIVAAEDIMPLLYMRPFGPVVEGWGLVSGHLGSNSLIFSCSAMHSLNCVF